MAKLLPPGTPWFDEHVKCRKRHLRTEILKRADEDSKLLTGAVSKEERDEVMWTLLEAEAQLSLSYDIADFLEREGMPEEAKEVSKGGVTANKDLNRQAYVYAASLVANSVHEKTAAVERGRKTGGMHGGKVSRITYAKAYQILKDWAVAMNAKDGKWPSITDAEKKGAALKEADKNLDVPDRRNTYRDWLIEFGKPAGKPSVG